MVIYLRVIPSDDGGGGSPAETERSGITNNRREKMENDIIKISHFHYGDTTVKVVRETAKAILLAGNASEAWFPKAALDAPEEWARRELFDGDDARYFIADWMPLRLEHAFLFQSPFNPTH